MKTASNNRTEARFTACASPASKPASPPPAPQLELGFGSARACSAAGRRQRRLNRARWWFQKMRQVVNSACDWQPAPPPQPEQIWFQEACLQPAPAGGLSGDERQMCE